MTRSLFGLEGKRILVLGGGFGMGEATVRLLASLGCHVAIVDREQDRAERVAAEVAGSVEAMPLAVDVLDDEALVAAIAGIERDFGPLDGMATVIGMAAWGSLLDIDIATWDEDQNRNLRYFFVAAREVARLLMARQAPGTIVCVSSVDGMRSAPNHGSYGAAKAGLINLVRTMAVEWSPFGIRVNVVAPGPIVTPRIPHRGDEEESKMMVNVPMHRRGTVQDIANAITFFLSDMSPYVTGQVLAVDGGSLATNPFFPLAYAPPGYGDPA
jgi:3-oxoacyl-[acyl-carrier protein] reductase